MTPILPPGWFFPSKVASSGERGGQCWADAFTPAISARVERTAGPPENALPAGSGWPYRGVMTFWQGIATQHGYENPCSLLSAAILREDSQPRTGKVAM
jgi:hypothetical protein